MQYYDEFKNYLSKDEKLIYSGKPLFFTYMSSGFSLFILGIVWFIINQVFFYLPRYYFTGFIIFDVMSLFMLLPFFISVLNLLKLALSYKNIFYAITNKKIIVKSGLFKKSVSNLNFQQIISSNVSYNLFEKINNSGSIEFIDASVNKGERNYQSNYLKFIGISDVDTVYDLFLKESQN